MFQFGGFPSATYGFSCRSTVLHRRGCPIRKSTGQSLFPAHRGLSQVVASFIGSWCQGIHLMLFFAWTAPLAFVLSRFASCLSFANNCLGCGSQKDHSFCSSTVFSTESFDSLAKLFGIHLCIPPLYRKDLLISQLKNLLNTTICFVSYLYSVFNEHLPVTLRLLPFVPFGTGRPPRPPRASLCTRIEYGVPPLATSRLLVGPSGLEPPTSCLSGTRSNHLSYEPSFFSQDP